MLKRDVLRKEISVEHIEAYWSSHDGLNLYSQSWLPENSQPKAIINLIHGHGEHSGRYQSWAAQFVEAGYAVRSFDHRGHGRSAGKRGFAQGINRMIRDIEDFILKGKEEFPDTPIFNYGHSMGGNLVLNHTIQQNTAVDGLIITSPWLELKNPPSPIKLILANAIGQLIPWLTVKSTVKAEDVSHDLKVVHTYKNDPLNHGRIGLKIFSDLFDGGIKASMSIYKINVPLLVMHGDADNITSCKATRNFVRNASAKTTYHEWEDAYHELHNDHVSEKVFEAILEWLNRQVKSLK